MQPSSNGARDRRPGPLTVVGLAVLVGLVGGVVLSFRDTVRAVLGAPNPTIAFPEMLRFGLAAAARYALIGSALLTVVGACVWLLVATRRARIPRSRLVPLALAMLVFVFVSVLLMLRGEAHATTPLEWLLVLIESVAIGLGSGAGVGLGAGLLLGKLGRRRAAALLVAMVPALFLLSNWGLWTHMAALRGHGAGWARLGLLGTFAVAALLGSGLYLVAAPAKGSRRRACGALLLALAAGLFACVHLGLRPTERAPAVAAPAPPATPAGRPNVLWIVMDTCRADALSCYGPSVRKTTPRLDALAAESVLYTHAISPSSWTLPSHAAMFTGTLVSRNGTSAERRCLGTRLPTVAEALARHGYRTYGYSNNEFVAEPFGLHRGFERFRLASFGATWGRLLLAGRFDGALGLSDYGASETVATARRWMARCASAGEPFFVFLNFMEAHGWYGSTPGFARWLPKDVDAQKARRLGNTDFSAYNVDALDVSADDFRIVRALYDADMTYLDAQIGRLVDGLRELGVLENTLLVVTSDHGEHFGEHRLWEHRFSLYNELIHVPLIVRYPGGRDGGRRIAAPVSTIDIFPTILDVLDLPRDEGEQLQGRSLRQAHGHPSPRPLVSEIGIPTQAALLTVGHHRPARITWFLRRLKSIEDGGYKLIWASDGHHELYHVARDPREQANLIDTMPDKARELERKLVELTGKPLVRTAGPLGGPRGSPAAHKPATATPAH